MTKTRLIAFSALTVLLCASASMAPAYAGSSDIARGISGAIYAGAGARLCGAKCAKVGYDVGTGVFDSARKVTTTIGPKIKWPRKK